MNVGIVGLGVVGSACKFGFEKLGHTIYSHDLKLNTKLEDLCKTDIIFICVPTPSLESGACDTSIVKSIIGDLHQFNYDGVVCIKSTVSPGTTQSFIDVYKNSKICMVPEFLRERYAFSDFTENHDICVIGTVDDKCFEIVKSVHGNLPKKFFQTTPTEAELSKYFNNVYNSTLIVFANSFYEVCKYFSVDYTKIKNIMVKRNHIFDMYLECNENFRGFAGMCLPKDTKELSRIGEIINVEFFKHLLSENNKYKKTVIGNMRVE